MTDNRRYEYTGYRSPIYETKVVQVNNSPDVINATNQTWCSFGWSVQNVQVTHSQDTRTYTKDFADYYTGSKTVETTTINYATITYQRDKNMPNYSKLVQLENSYNNLNYELSTIQNSCTVDPFNFIYFLFGLFIPVFGGGMKYLKEYRTEKQEAERKKSAYIQNGYFERINRQKKQILQEASRLF